MSNRTVRVNELVQREISDILRKRYQTEAVAMTISEVRVSPDLRDARVFVAVVGSDEVAEQKLKWIRSKAADIREEVSRRIVLKYLPKFEYLLDHSAIRGARILQVIDALEYNQPADGAPASDEAEADGEKEEKA
ncbi:MAG: 30S ribosome-binding factor RbfA [Verrucomicrobiota bacterium]